MRYLFPVSLALIVLMALACTTEPKPTATPQGTPVPKFQSGDAMDMVLAHLKTIPGEFWVQGIRTTNCYDYLIAAAVSLGEHNDARFIAKEDYLGDGIWQVYIDNKTNSGDIPHVPPTLYFRWKVNERTHLVTGDPYPAVAEKIRNSYRFRELSLAICSRWHLSPSTKTDISPWNGRSASPSAMWNSA